MAAETPLLERPQQQETVDITQLAPFELNVPLEQVPGHNDSLVTTGDMYANTSYTNVPLNPIENSVYDRAASGAVIDAQLEGRALDPAEISSAADRALQEFRANAEANPASLNATIPEAFKIALDDKLRASEQVSTDFQWGHKRETLDEVIAHNAADRAEENFKALQAAEAQQRDAAETARQRAVEQGAVARGTMLAQYFGGTDAGRIGQVIAGGRPPHINEQNYPFTYTDENGRDIPSTTATPSTAEEPTQSLTIPAEQPTGSRVGPRPHHDPRPRADTPNYESTSAHEGALADSEELTGQIPSLQPHASEPSIRAIRPHDRLHTPELPLDAQFDEEASIDPFDPYVDPSFAQAPDPAELFVAEAVPAAEPAEPVAEEVTEPIQLTQETTSDDSTEDEADETPARRRKMRERLRDARDKVTGAVRDKARDWWGYGDLPAAEYMPGYGPRTADGENVIESNEHGDVIDAGYVQLPRGGMSKRAYKQLREEHKDLPANPTVALMPEQRDAVVRDQIRAEIFSDPDIQRQATAVVLAHTRPFRGEAQEAYTARVNVAIEDLKDRVYFDETMRRGVAVPRPAEPYPETLPRPKHHRRTLFGRQNRR